MARRARIRKAEDGKRDYGSARLSATGRKPSLIADGRPVPAKVSLQLERGQRLRIESAGGGGWGEPVD